MITAESLFFAILGTTRAEITPSVLATEITAELLFDENLGFDDFRITKDVYPTVAKLLRRSSDSVSRSVERMTARLWRCGSPEQLRKNHRAGAAAAASRPGNDPVSGVLSACGASNLCAAVRNGCSAEPGSARDDRLAFRADGDVRNVAADGLFHGLYIVARFLRQVLIAAHAGNVAVPARHGAGRRLCLRQDGGKGKSSVSAPFSSYCTHSGTSFLPGQHHPASSARPRSRPGCRQP